MNLLGLGVEFTEAGMQFLHGNRRSLDEAYSSQSSSSQNLATRARQRRLLLAMLRGDLL